MFESCHVVIIISSKYISAVILTKISSGTGIDSAQKQSQHKQDIVIAKAMEWFSLPIKWLNYELLVTLSSMYPLWVR